MLLKYEQDGVTYAEATGRLYNLKSRETQSGKPMATFSVAYDYTMGDFGDKAQNKYISAVAFAYLAEYIQSLDDGQHKIHVLICGKLQTKECNGITCEEILCDFIIGQPLADSTIKRAEERQKKEDEDYDDLNF